MRYKDLLFQRFGRLVVRSFIGTNHKGAAVWECLCDCGGIKAVDAPNLTKGSTQSCGCLAIEQKRNAAQYQCHEFSRSMHPKEYGAWSGMVRRCYSSKHPSYPRYGGRGIGVCDDWRYSFKTFYTDMGDAPKWASIERIDNEADYAPDNCRWATKKEQANNRRSNRVLTFDGKTMNVTQWAKHLGWPKSTIANRLSLGWSIERTLSEPPQKRHNQTP